MDRPEWHKIFRENRAYKITGLRPDDPFAPGDSIKIEAVDYVSDMASAAFITPKALEMAEPDLFVYVLEKLNSQLDRASSGGTPLSSSAAPPAVPQ